MADDKAPFSLSAKIFSIALVLIILVAAAVSWYFYMEYQKAQALLKNPSSALAQKDKEIIAKVGKLIELPSEQPTLAEVSDKSKLANQAFFANAENGDKVLIFSHAKKAILYRPATNKIIEVGPVNVATSPAPQVAGESSEETASASPDPSKTIAIAIYNGTTKVGLTNVAEKQLTDAKTNVEVVLKDNAAKKTYEESVVIDLSGKQKPLVDSIAKTIGAKTGTLPVSEAKPDPTESDGKTAEILVILGSDFIK